MLNVYVVNNSEVPGKQVALNLINDILHSNYTMNDICISLHGKPYISKNPIYFNISHSGRWLAIAISDCEVGVDIQVPRDICSKVLGVNTVEWVKYESYMKMLGCGLDYNHAIQYNISRRFTIIERPEYALSVVNIKNEIANICN